jgi:multiple sugar transport system permease protein
MEAQPFQEFDVPIVAESAAGQRRNNITGYLFALPWFIGFFGFTLYPMISSLYYSFTSFNTMQAPKWIGLRNYTVMFTRDPLFWKSVGNTFYYAALSVPAGIIASLTMAVLLNQKARGIRVFRTLFYLPTVISSVALSLLWLWMFEPSYGLLNTFLSWFGVKGPKWLSDPAWAKPSLVLMSIWTVGGNMLIYLAALQDVPKSLHEAAFIDGAGVFTRFTRVTIPMITPTIFFSLVTGFIGSMQVFGQAFIMTGGGPAYSTYFYAYELYDKAFVSYQMGFASAMAWVLLVITMILSLAILGTSRKWVYYEGDK